MVDVVDEDSTRCTEYNTRASMSMASAQGRRQRNIEFEVGTRKVSAGCQGPGRLTALTMAQCFYYGHICALLAAPDRLELVIEPNCWRPEREQGGSSRSRSRSNTSP